MRGVRSLIQRAFTKDITRAAHCSVAALAIIIFGGLLAGAFPAWRAYRQSLADGMMVRT